MLRPVQLWRQTTTVFRPQVLLSTECDRRNLLIAFTIRCVDNTCDVTRKWKRRRASFLLQWRYSCYIYTLFCMPSIVTVFCGVARAQ